MRALLSVFRKEVRENLRDRRSLWSALLFGPLFGPLMFGAMVSRTLHNAIAEPEEPIEVMLCGAERAPGLVAYLESRGVKLIRATLTEQAARDAVLRGSARAVLWIPADYAARFQAVEPAPLLLYADSSDSKNGKTAERLRALLANYAQNIASLRLQLRGVNPSVALPVAVNDIDVATPSGRAVLVLGFMTYFVLFAMLMGGLYLAIDATAGERERGSLEALLTLPVARTQIVVGKILAASLFMCLSLAITLAAFVVVFRFVHLEALGMSSNLGPRTAFELFLIDLPFVPLGAALMTFVASFTKSYREAQTYLTGVLLIPTLPIAFATIYSLKTDSALMAIPSLSQHLLMTGVLRDESLAPGDVLVSAAASLAVAIVLIVATARHWRRESLLG
jgi:sodium transport system permease protein